MARRKSAHFEGRRLPMAPENSGVEHFMVPNHAISFDKRIFPAHKLAALVNTLGELGVTAAELLSGSGITEKELRSSSTHISYRQMDTLFRNALRLSPDPAFALRAGLHMRVTAYGMYGYGLMSSASHEEGIDFAAKYHLVMGPVARMTYTKTADEVIFEYNPILSRDTLDVLYHNLIEFTLSSHLTLNRDLYGSAFKFSEVGLKYPEPEYSKIYGDIFKCRVLFGQNSNSIRFKRKWLDEPIPLSDPITNSASRELCEQIFIRGDFPLSIATKIRHLLLDRPGWFPKIEVMSSHLSMNTRKLHRMLEAENTCYRNLIKETRMILAIKYLRETQMTNEDIAERLGYSDAANFRHAFVRWTGSPPSDYRA